MKEESWELSRIALKGAAVVWESAALVAGEREWAQWAWLKREKLLSLGYGAWCNQRSFYVALFIKCRVKCALTSRVYYTLPSCWINIMSKSQPEILRGEDSDLHCFEDILS